MTSETEVTDAQIAGLLLSVAALMGEIRRKGLLDEKDVDSALGRLADDISGSRLAQATPDDKMITATLAPIQQLRRMNSMLDEKTGEFPGWITADNG